ncbi:MAG: HAD family hydrolase [Candidatus Omnitrophica bacterium]|nr:HAD family hydrolase [Candidatus Omnitrophota bacterium]
MKKKLAIFDLDGTLIDAFDSIYQTINYICEKLNIEKFEYEKVKRAVGEGDLKLIINLFKNEQLVKKAHIFYRENYLKFIKNNVKVLDGACEFLNQLKEKEIKIALATNRSKFSLIPILKETNLEEFFDTFLCADDVERIKPDSEMIFKIIEKFNLNIKETFYVGDMYIDYLTGINAGVDTYIVLTGAGKIEDFKIYNSALLFENLNKLNKFLVENKII